MKPQESGRIRATAKAVPQQIAIEVMNGPEDGRVVVCDKMPICIGRASDNEVHLPFDHLISRHHARLIETGGKIALCDLNSTNGTFVGSKRVQDRVMIERNRLFRVGATTLTIRSHGAEAIRD